MKEKEECAHKIYPLLLQQLHTHTLAPANAVNSRKQA